MNINFENIREIYGEEALKVCSDNIEYLVQNINYLIQLGFDNYDEIVERYPLAFVEEAEIVKHRLDKLIERLGVDYLEILNENMNLFEELL